MKYLCQVMHLLTLYFGVVIIFLFQRSLYNCFRYFCFCFYPKCLECVKPLFSFQVLVAIILLPVKRSCSRFSTSEEFIPSSWRNTSINDTQCMTAQLTDPLLVLIICIMTSTYRATLWATDNLIQHVVQHILFPWDIQPDGVGFSMEFIFSVLLTLKCFTK